MSQENETKSNVIPWPRPRFGSEMPQEGDGMNPVTETIAAYPVLIEEAKILTSRARKAKQQAERTKDRIEKPVALEVSKLKSEFSNAELREAEVVRRLSLDPNYVEAFRIYDEADDLITEWDARLSRLRREFEVAKIDHARKAGVHFVEMVARTQTQFAMQQKGD